MRKHDFLHLKIAQSTDLSHKSSLHTRGGNTGIRTSMGCYLLMLLETSGPTPSERRGTMAKSIFLNNTHVVSLKRRKVFFYTTRASDRLSLLVQFLRAQLSPAAELLCTSWSTADLHHHHSPPAAPLAAQRGTQQLHCLVHTCGTNV
jgi:hypothetical protein